ncbi:class I adenylate-forming enzyme family protein [Pseudorhodoferax soli]|uniref:Acyl-CoA synthetase (AMP-forming)/AMP-acid ligase II n=1 Tax=Pseudorhodoferax soli TaxID=545864 RepID=A0A368XKM8_9BURK|nr:AMP-binding protein [Pseudorhodoferax soli]RCW68523.1 acyl-CoA synthetase (AMP-forming)/AMP-acid ligase II [Pseudorhodoferax soli]
MIRTDLIAPIGVLVHRHAKDRPAKVAFEDARGASVTYGELAAKTAGAAGHLQDRGLDPGDTVAIMLPNSVDWVLSCVAIARAGCIGVPISHEATEAEVRYRLEDARCKAIVVAPQHLPLIEQLRPELPHLRLIILSGSDDPTDQLSLALLVQSAARSEPRDPTDLHATAFIVYTSGTTGRPKGVMLSQHSMLWVVAACWAPIAGLSADDVLLAPLPLYHSYALNLCVLGVLATGATEFLLEKFSTQDVLGKLRSGRYTLMPGVPTVFHYLLEGGRAAGATAVPGVRYFISAGAILPAALNRDFEAAFGRPLLDGYGITETSTMVTMNAPQVPRTMGSCGVPLPGVAVRIVDGSGQDVPVGEEGQLIVRGPNVMQGYLNKPQETAAALAGGWYQTGDLARSDDNGYLTITGRLKELIIRGGQNIAPAEVEEAVLSHPAVLDCAAIGVAHPFLGEVPVVCVVAREGHAIDGEAIRAHCAQLISPYKVPQSVNLVSSIPRTGSGKILRFKLREAIGSVGAA